MSFDIDNKKSQTDAYWLQMDRLYAEAEEKNLIAAIKKTDTEKFYTFTSMLRVANTLNKIKVLQKK
jgi:hypothetical protein